MGYVGDSANVGVCGKMCDVSTNVGVVERCGM